MGPNSLIAVYMDPLGCVFGYRLFGTSGFGEYAMASGLGVLRDL